MSIPLPQYDYQRIADQIANEIASGRLPVGARLPGQHELREIHGVSLGTVRRVLRELTQRGLVHTLPAKGTYVIARPEDGTADESETDPN